MAEAGEREAVQSADALTGDGEPWESWESRLVIWTIAIGIVGLFVLAWLVNKFILT
jgi:hypothetical protein